MLPKSRVANLSNRSKLALSQTLSNPDKRMRERQARKALDPKVQARKALDPKVQARKDQARKALDRKDLDRRQAANKAPALKRKLKLVSRDQTLKDRTQCKPATKDLQPSRSKSQQWLQPLQLSPRGRFGKTTTVTRNNLR